MFFSIVIPCFNSEKTIIRALKSIKLQSFKNYELIVIDDGSSDKTPTIFEGLNDIIDYPVKPENREYVIY